MENGDYIVKEMSFIYCYYIIIGYYVIELMEVFYFLGLHCYLVMGGYCLVTRISVVFGIVDDETFLLGMLVSFESSDHF